MPSTVDGLRPYMYRTAGLMLTTAHLFVDRESPSSQYRESRFWQYCRRDRAIHSYSRKRRASINRLLDILVSVYSCVHRGAFVLRRGKVIEV